MRKVKKFVFDLKSSPYLLTLVISILLSTFILAIQYPFCFYSPDISFHASKILRAMNGNYFIDPFSGTETIYHPLFHIFFGLLNNLLNFNSIQLMWFIEILDFLGLFLSFFFLAKVILESNELASIATLALSLIFYSPTGHYILLQNPSNFALIFVLLGFCFSFRYIKMKKFLDLAIGLILWSIAINIWWFYLIPFIAFLVVFFIYNINQKYFLKNLFFSLLLAAIPCIFLIWHFYSIRSILPDYIENAASSSESLNTAAYSWIFNFITKGNFQFQNYLYPYCLGDDNLLSYISEVSLIHIYSIISSIHYYLVILPINILIVFTPLIYLYKKNIKNKNYTKYTDIFANLLFWESFSIFLFSISVIFIGNIHHLRRVQFIVYILLLLFTIKVSDSLASLQIRKNIFRILTVLSIFSLIFTVIHTPNFYPSKVNPGTKEVIEFINSVPDHQNIRIFLLEEDLRSLAPFVEFKSFVGNKDGTYYSQDPVSSQRLLSSYNSIKRMNYNWKDSLKNEDVKYMIFKLSGDELSDELVEFYKAKGKIVLSNSEWVIIEVTYDNI